MLYNISKPGVWISTGTISADTPWIVKAGAYSVVEGNAGDLHLYIFGEKTQESAFMRNMAMSVMIKLADSPPTSRC